MKYLDEYRELKPIQKLSQIIADITTKSWKIMEVCGGQTHSIMKFGIDTLLPPSIELIHGPGCPVCVTPIELIDKAIEIAKNPEVIFCSFGDMLRVPGSLKDLFAAKADGAEVKVVYSPLDAVKMARDNPDRQVVFFAVGFETTAPANAMAAYQARKCGLKNFSILVSHFLVPPAMQAILESPENLVQGFLAAGHVCTVMGYEEYIPLVKKYKIPIVVTGFEPLDILQGIYLCVKQLENGSYEVINQYSRAVKQEGNTKAQEVIEEVFENSGRLWRGIGQIPSSGLTLRRSYREYDAEHRFGVAHVTAQEDPTCISGLIMRGQKKPCDCPNFAKTCTPDKPLGAPMVSTEGACSAYYLYRNL